MGNTALKKHYATAEKTGVLNISNRKLVEFPVEVKQLKSSLRSLDLSSNKFSKLPPDIGSFLNLKSLIVDYNNLTELPMEIGNLNKLENLSITNNKLRSLPQSLSKLCNLKELSLQQNQLTEFPVMLCDLKHLNMVDLSLNKITEIPDGISKLHVVELILNQNQISSLSPDIADCPRLKTLRMQENCLALNSIPVKILNDSNISTLSIEGNLFEMKQFINMEGYDSYMERYTAVKKKLS
ncbi:leucine-rich repeat-containing protein 57-like [Rhodnius prolixus]|uniref:Disease resistance R13L4/SHOC-2-like LRR domain-containing protein n=1 Tax=Rhodnius prolixus TaxID=13249 RepID=T1HVL8_RHOPR